MTAVLAALTVLALDENSWGYVTATYVIAIVTLVAYAISVIVRGRRVGRQLPPDERRWS